PAYEPPPHQHMMPAPPPLAQVPQQRLTTQPTAAGRSRWPWVLFAVLMFGAVGAAGWFAYLKMNQHEPRRITMKGSNGPRTGSAGSAVVAAGPGSGSAVTNVDPTPPPRAPIDAAAVAQVVDAAAPKPAPADAATVTPTGPSDALQIASTPPGARVYLDGADQ